MAEGLFENVYNPDVLSCLANLSNDEVFTPPEVVNQMLDMLPQELFSDPDTTFLDPACKTGVFLRETAKRLIKGLEPQFPDLQERIDHIFHKQLFGIAITELTSLLSRRGLYCSKYPNSNYSVSRFDDAQGNIRFKRISHKWEKGKCVYCGASESQYERGDELETHAYEWIHTIKPEEIFNMKFDVIISKPPYQLSDGGAGASAMPIYQKFVTNAMKMKPKYITMIIPSRWFAGGRGLNDFRDHMKQDKHIEYIFDYQKSRECFNGVDIAGGVCYFLWNNSFNGPCTFVSVNRDKRSESVRYLDEFDIILRDNIGISVIKKISKIEKDYLSSSMLTINPFGLRSYERGENEHFDNCITLISSAGKGYINRESISKNSNVIDDYKICIGYLNPDRAGVNNAADGLSNVITKIRILKPGEVVTETYIIPYHNKEIKMVQNCAKYLTTKFARFMIFITLSSMHIAQNNLQFVPMQDFSKPWTDEELYAKYGLTQEEIDFIESMIKPMELGGE